MSQPPPPPSSPPPSTPPPTGPDQSGQPDQPSGTVRVHLQGSAMMNGMRPSLRINGYLVPAQWGPNDYTLPVGRHTVYAEAQWMRTYGQAELQVDVNQGETVDVWYAMPYTQFQRGSMGLVEQKRAGRGAFAAIMGVAVLIAVLLVLLAIVTG